MAVAISMQATPTNAAVFEPFKVANIPFETNASGCDMGIQMFFDTDGITTGSVEDPNRHVVYCFRASGGMEETGGQTEGFLEGVEPQIAELLNELGCEPSDEEEVISIEELFAAWPLEHTNSRAKVTRRLSPAKRF